MTNERDNEKEELEKFEKELNKKIVRMLFPTLSTMPLPWIILAILVLLFNLFTCVL